MLLGRILIYGLMAVIIGIGVCIVIDDCNKPNHRPHYCRLLVEKLDERHSR